MAKVRIFEVLSDKLNIVGICESEITNRKGSLDFKSIILYYLLNFSYRLKNLKEGMLQKFLPELLVT